MHYYSQNIGDYRRDTTHLTMLEHGAYRQLIDTYYLTEKPLTLVHANLMRTHCARSADEVQAVENVIRDFFVRTEEGYIHKRCDIEIEAFHAKSTSASESAKARWDRVRAEKEANAMRTHSEGNANHKPLTINQYPPIPPEGESAPANFDGTGFTISPELFDKWIEAYTKIDVLAEIKRAAVWAAANPSKRKKNWARFLNTWLSRQHKASNAVDETGCPVDKIIDLYHRECQNLPHVSVKTDAVLRGLIVERWNETEAHKSSAFWKTIFQRANRVNQIYHRGANVLPRLELICSRATFRQLEEQA